MDAVNYAARCRQVAAAFVAAFPEYVAVRLGPFVGNHHELAISIEASRRDLEAGFGRWAETAARQQSALPLELFREALLGPTQRTLALGGVPEARSGMERDALPGDVFGIAPATSRDLGDDAWKAHVAWGLARAETIAGMVPRPGPAPAGVRVALFGSNLMDRARIEAAAGAAGYEIALWRNPAALAGGVAAGPPAIVLVDLQHPAALDAIRTLSTLPARVIAFGPHVDDHAQAAAGALGADDVLTRSQFFRRLPGLFPTAT
ncbi:MAG TPA: hypothetical protein VLG28_16240 [Acidimicrobiia bacterium]|jgi:CheY-like chemotaxis protein|nr:hypothetical protein [Acidimicrobiia bacterium]